MATVRKTIAIELKLFLREPLTLAFVLSLPLIVLYVLNGVFGNSPDPEVYDGVGPADFYLSAYVALTVANIGVLALPVHLANYRERGVLRRFHVSGLPRSALVTAGTLLGAVLPTAPAAQGIGVILFFVLMMLGGAGPPREVLPSFMARLGDVLPLTYAARASREPWLEGTWHLDASLVVAGILLVCAVASVRLFRWN